VYQPDQYWLQLVHIRELFDLSGRIALVTGGSRGLGLEIARGLGEAGASVAITARREQWLKPAEEALRADGVDCLAKLCDVSQADQVSTAVSAVIERYGRVDILINNAGVSWAEPAESMPIEKWRSVFDTNVAGCFLMSQAVGAAMIRAGHGGAIVNIASIAGLVGTPSHVLDAVGYSASKGAVISLTRDLAVKWAPHGIRVNAIAPGFFETRMTAGVLERSRGAIEGATPMGRVGRPEELRGVAVFLASTAASYITGQVIVVDGGATAW
jgi:NAD(P)-dependent dehydrogenase (short-subunit alcohol dehydrogenase family)